MFHKYKLENLIIIPRIVTIHYLELDKSFSYEGERHDFWEMVYADSEEIGVRAGERSFVLQEGQAVKVLVLSTENGKVNLSIKRTLPKPEPSRPDNFWWR